MTNRFAATLTLLALLGVGLSMGHRTPHHSSKSVAGQAPAPVVVAAPPAVPPVASAPPAPPLDPPATTQVHIGADPLRVTGPSRVIDADTVSVNQVHVRLLGVDAAELRTPLGEDAKQVMIGIVGVGPLTCVLTGAHTWHREVGTCFTANGTNINREIIAMGAALACPRYSTRYLPDELPEALVVQQRASYCVRHP